MARADRWLAAALLLSCGCYLAVYRASQLTELAELRNLLATLCATLPYALAVYWVSRGERQIPAVPEAPGPSASLTRWDWALLVGGACALRLALPLTLVEGTSDPFRYLWDGRVLADGINPYLHAPQAPQLAHLRDALIYPQVFRPDMRTVYPPLSELWFLVAHLLTPGSVAGLKLVLLAHELCSVLLLVRYLGELGLPPRRALVYAWSPLAVVQLFAGAHLDGLMIPWLILALRHADRRPAMAGLALAAAALVRPLALLLLPALALRRPLRATLLAGSSCVLLFVAAWLPFAGAGSGLWESLLVYGSEWRFNGLLFPLLEGWHGGQHPWVRRRVYLTIAAGSLVLGLVPRPTRQRWLLVLGLYFALSPTVYPWYLLPVVALAAPAPGPLVVVLPLLVTLSDMAFVAWLAARDWNVPGLFLWLEYGGLAGLLAWEGAWALRKRGAIRA